MQKILWHNFSSIHIKDLVFHMSIITALYSHLRIFSFVSLLIITAIICYLIVECLYFSPKYPNTIALCIVFHIPTNAVSQKKCLKKSNDVYIILTKVPFRLNKLECQSVRQSSDLYSPARSDAATAACCTASTAYNSSLNRSNLESLGTLSFLKSKALSGISVGIISSVKAVSRSSDIAVKTG